jgi:nitroreductase
VAPKTHGNSMADSANALENMQIAATALGLGACWVNQLHWLTENKALRDYLEPLGLKQDEDVFGSIVVGHPDQPLPKPSARKEGRVVMIK